MRRPRASRGRGQGKTRAFSGKFPTSKTHPTHVTFSIPGRSADPLGDWRGIPFQRGSVGTAEQAEDNVSASGADGVDMNRKENIADRTVEPGRDVLPPLKVPAEHRTSGASANSRVLPQRFQDDTAWDEV